MAALPPHLCGGLRRAAAQAAGRKVRLPVAVPVSARVQPGSKTKITALAGQDLMDRCLLLAADLKKLKKADAKRRAALPCIRGCSRRNAEEARQAAGAADPSSERSHGQGEGTPVGLLSAPLFHPTGEFWLAPLGGEPGSPVSRAPQAGVEPHCKSRGAGF